MVFALQPGGWISGSPSVQLYLDVSQDEQGRSSEVFRSSVGRAEVHGQLHALAQHFLDVPMPRHLISDDNVAFYVLDSDLASVYGVVRSEKDQAMEDQ